VIGKWWFDVSVDGIFGEVQAVTEGEVARDLLVAVDRQRDSSYSTLADRFLSAHSEGREVLCELSLYVSF